MAGIIIQFHALPEELASFVSGFGSEYKLNIFAVLGNTNVILVDTEQTIAGLLWGQFWRLLICEGEPPNHMKTTRDLANWNADLLFLDTGRNDKAGLHESCLSCRVEGRPLNKKWKAIAAQLKKITKVSPIAVNIDSGISGVWRNHRYTDGAKSLSDKGVPILPVAGGNRFRFA